jgi:hypothetical protein
MADIIDTANTTTIKIDAAISALWARHSQPLLYSVPFGCGGYVHLKMQPELMAEIGFREACKELAAALTANAKANP